MGYDQAPSQASTTRQPSQTPASSGTNNLLIAAVGSLSIESLVEIMDRNPAQRDAIMLELTRTQGTEVAKRVYIELQSSHKSALAINTSLRLAASHIAEARAALSASTNEAAEEPLRMASAARCEAIAGELKDVWGELSSMQLNERSKGSLVGALYEIDGNLATFDTALGKLPDPPSTTAINVQLNALYGQCNVRRPATPPPARDTSPAATLESNEIDQHLAAARMAAQAIMAGNGDQRRLELHMDKLSCAVRARRAPSKAQRDQIKNALGDLRKPPMGPTYEAQVDELAKWS